MPSSSLDSLPPELAAKIGSECTPMDLRSLAATSKQMLLATSVIRARRLLHLPVDLKLTLFSYCGYMDIDRLTFVCNDLRRFIKKHRRQLPLAEAKMEVYSLAAGVWRFAICYESQYAFDGDCDRYEEYQRLCALPFVDCTVSYKEDGTKKPHIAQGMEDYLTTERGRKRLRGLLHRFHIDEILIYDDGHFPAMWATMTESLLNHFYNARYLPRQVEIRNCDFADMRIGDWGNFLRFLSACWTDDDPCPSARGIEKLVLNGCIFPNADYLVQAMHDSSLIYALDSYSEIGAIRCPTKANSIEVALLIERLLLRCSPYDGICKRIEFSRFSALEITHWISIIEDWMMVANNENFENVGDEPKMAVAIIVAYKDVFDCGRVMRGILQRFPDHKDYILAGQKGLHVILVVHRVDEKLCLKLFALPDAKIDECLDCANTAKWIFEQIFGVNGGSSATRDKRLNALRNRLMSIKQE